MKKSFSRRMEADSKISKRRLAMTRMRKPTTPGEILEEEYLKPLGLSQKELADHIECDIKVINRIINGRSTVSVTIAIKLASAFDTTPEFWLNAQRAVDLFEAAQKMEHKPASLLHKTSRRRRPIAASCA